MLYEVITLIGGPGRAQRDRTNARRLNRLAERDIADWLYVRYLQSASYNFV